jgi:hypothetical protein
MIKTLRYTTAGTFLLALIGAAIANHASGLGEHAPRVSVKALANEVTGPGPDAHATDIPPHSQLIGMALNLYHTDQLDLYHDALEQMSQSGFNAVQIVTPIFQVDGGAQEVRLEHGRGRGPSMDDIASLLSHAKQLGMATMLMPQISFTHPRGNEWRGKLQPEHWAPWWQSYHKTIDLFLDIAIENEVDVFVVGCELLTTHKPEHEARWRELIAHCRGRFAGQLTYSTTWDTYHKVAYWDSLDAVGVSAYWDITTLAEDRDHPTSEDLRRRWVEIKHRLLAYAQAQARPVLLTEVGYPSLPWALKDPWNYINSDLVEPDHEAQAKGYAAFIAAWSDTIIPTPPADLGNSGTPDISHALGVFFHKWDPYHQGGPDDTGYGLIGKPAYRDMADWLNLLDIRITPTVQ